MNKAQQARFDSLYEQRVNALPASLLKDFGQNDKSFAAELAMMAVLHTHSRRSSNLG